MEERINNPLNPKNCADNHFPDPHIKIFINPDTGRENMYIYVGHDNSKEDFVMSDWYVMWSEDLVHWQVKKILDRKDTYMKEDSTDCWACDCVQSPWDGKYYLYYSNRNIDTGVAVCERPDGSFVDARLKKPLIPKGLTTTSSYDPDIILPDEKDPHAYILFGCCDYYAMQLDESMINVVPDTLRHVAVYPSDGTTDELEGVLRSDQPEACFIEGRWYLYWAGRYAVSDNRFGPYIFHSNIGKEIPQYPDGRCFIDHGSFVKWHGQWFYAVTRGIETPFYRQSWLLYLHVCDDGTLMIDETIRRCGVGQYCAQWEKIEAEWYMSIEDGLRKVELKENNKHSGFALLQESGNNSAQFPHIYDLPENPVMTLQLKGRRGAKVEVLIDEEPAGKIELKKDEANFIQISLPLIINSGEHDFKLVFTGYVVLDRFSFK